MEVRRMDYLWSVGPTPSFRGCSERVLVEYLVQTTRNAGFLWRAGKPGTVVSDRGRGPQVFEAAAKKPPSNSHFLDDYLPRRSRVLTEGFYLSKSESSPQRWLNLTFDDQV
jgi:hypothetical protein